LGRDNFRKNTIEVLKARVAYRCSNPDCRVQTIAPAEGGKVNNIGIAAHIFAASKGGPRPNQSITSEERKSIDNGIWLCSNCSINIDKDEKRYSPELLRQWKIDAEDQARAELGKKLPSENEAIDTVAAAFTGMPKGVIANAISNVHKATEISLSQLDPRFHIKTQYIDGKSSIGIYAKENVSLELKVDAKYAKEYVDQHRQLIEHGSDVQISTEGFSIEGSKLFEKVFEDVGILHVSGLKKKAIQKFWLVQDDTHLVEGFDDISGEIAIGTKSLTFNGSACEGIFRLSYKKEIDNESSQVNFNISLSNSSWEDQDIQHLPYFEKIFSLFDKMAEGWSILTSLEVEGLNILKSSPIKVSKCDYIQDTTTLLHYVNRCKVIAKKFDFQVSYTPKVSFSAVEHKNIADIVDIIEEKKTYSNEDMSENATCTIVADNDCQNINSIADINKPTTIRLMQGLGETIKLFNSEFNLPPQIIYIGGVLPKFHGNIQSIRAGEEIKVEWIPQDNFKCLVSYKSDSEHK